LDITPPTCLLKNGIESIAKGKKIDQRLYDA
jgi:hypothetical protein